MMRLDETSSRLSFEGKLESHRRKRGSCHAKLGSCHAKLSSYRWKLRSYRTKLPSCHAKLLSYRTKLLSYHAKLFSFQSKLSSYRTKLSSYRTKLSSYCSKLWSYHAKLSSYCSKLWSYHAKLASYRSKLVSYHAKLRSDRSKLPSGPSKVMTFSFPPARGPPSAKRCPLNAHNLMKTFERSQLMANETVSQSPHVEAAKALLEKIRALRAEVPRFIHNLPEARRKLVQKYTLPDDFLESAGVSVQTFSRLEIASGTDAATVRDAFSFALAYDSVVQEAEAFAQSVAHTIRVQRAEAGASALDIYAIATRLSKQKDGAELIPYVEDMKKKLAARRKRSRKATLTPAPAPVPPVTPSKAV